MWKDDASDICWICPKYWGPGWEQACVGGPKNPGWGVQSRSRLMRVGGDVLPGLAQGKTLAGELWTYWILSKALQETSDGIILQWSCSRSYVI